MPSKAQLKYSLYRLVISTPLLLNLDHTYLLDCKAKLQTMHVGTAI